MSDLRSSDRIFLRGLAVDCIIGFIDWERRVKQTVVIDLEMSIDCRQAAIRDDVADTLNYKTVAKRLIAFVQESKFNLVETLVERIASLVLAEFGVEWVRVTLSKPGAIRGSRDVGVTIERTRAPLPARRL
ncbi:MAG TPA: dihydroneopterin aldolase [Steroidobacteraceae bacterium]|jgi:7,8-dihydroneopterin aldolase/epimerase/oxygenase